MSEIQEKPSCKLTRADGNVFMVIGCVSKALKEVGQFHQAREFSNKAFECESYQDVLKLCFEYVDVH